MGLKEQEQLLSALEGFIQRQDESLAQLNPEAIRKEKRKRRKRKRGKVWRWKRQNRQQIVQSRCCSK